jgi:cytochrome P450 family 710 subfamily A protein
LQFAWYSIIGLSLLAYLLWEQAWYLWRKGNTPGAPWIKPIVGDLFSMVVNPVPFWEKQRNFSRDGFSTTSMAGRLMVYITNIPIGRAVCARLEDFILYAHPNAAFLFGKENLIYMDRDVHKDFRRLWLPGLFNKNALNMYLHTQETVIRHVLKKLVARGGQLDMAQELRSMAALTSQEAFVGPYLSKYTDELPDRQELAADYLSFTKAFLTFPLPIPGTQLWAGMQADKRIRVKLAEMAKKSKEYTWNGGEPRCVLDFWTKTVKDEKAKNIADDKLMACTVLDFLFASQDATTSALAWTMALMAQYPHILARIRKEVETAFAKSGNQSVVENFDQFKYTQFVAVEILHFKPPVPMVPHLAKRDTELAPGFTVPKGAMIIPAIYAVAQENSPFRGEPTSPTSPTEEKIGDEENEIGTVPKNADPDFDKVLVFGAGQHKCPGRRYALQFVAAFLAILASEYEFKRILTPSSGGYLYLPTIFPGDSLYTLTARQETTTV